MVITNPTILSFEEALQKANEFSTKNECANKKRILLGNGFSKSYFGEFGYTTLFDAIKDKKENKRIKKVFQKYGNSNFEGVLRLLQDSAWLLPIYGLDNAEVKDDYEKVKTALSDAIVKVHPKHTGVMPNEKKLNCLNFLSFFDDVFTVNYDLLLYWVIMTQERSEKFGDYFTREDDTPEEYCEFVGNSTVPKHIYFLHGALHLFQERNSTIKIVWGEKTPLVSQIKVLMDKGKYPLVVAEGDSSAKVNQIKGNPYLKHSFDKFKVVQGHLFTFGFSMSEQDDHILEVVKNNDKIRHLWIGLKGNFEKKENKRFIRIAGDLENGRKITIKDRSYRKNSTGGDLQVHYFDAGSMNIWGEEYNSKAN